MVGISYPNWNIVGISGNDDESCHDQMLIHFEFKRVKTNVVIAMLVIIRSLA